MKKKPSGTGARRPIVLVANGTQRPAVNQAYWPAQAAMEEHLDEAVTSLGGRLVRAHPYRPKERHGFIDSQRYGMEIFAGIKPDQPLIVAAASWQYSYQILPGLSSHRGPILTVANWGGRWPGIVGILNLNASLRKAGVQFSSLWSESFDDPFFVEGLDTWIRTGSLRHCTDHVVPGKQVKLPAAARKAGSSLAAELRRHKGILGVFDVGCMGMSNAIIPEELLLPLGIQKERLSQAALYHAMTQVAEEEARGVYGWLLKKGITFEYGTSDASALTERQVVEQCRMYIAACRIGDRYGCDAIGIQYHHGLQDLCPSPGIVEGLLNNAERPHVRDSEGVPIRKGKPFPHFHKVDECAGVDAILTQRIHEALGQPVESSVYELRWGDTDPTGTTDAFVWALQAAGGAPPAHHTGAYRGTVGERQPPLTCRLGGSTAKGIGKPGELVWSRLFVEGRRLNLDLGRAEAIKLPPAETERRLQVTTRCWPILHTVLYGISRDQMLARHPADHILIAYAKSAAEADSLVYTKAAMAAELGIEVNFCGTRADGHPF